MTHSAYVGRFAPSPSGPLHAGSLVAAMASFLDARLHQGRWLVRIEDVDAARTVPGAADAMLTLLARFGMRSDAAVMVQSDRTPAYQLAFEKLGHHTFACTCTRKEIADSHSEPGSDGALIYPGTCRAGLPPGRSARAYRLRVPMQGDPAGLIRFKDRHLGECAECLATSVGDFVLKRADGFWAYQLAVVVDDAAQGITHVVRGADLLESTARQIYLQRLLGLATPEYLHVPVVLNQAGEKLSKQTGAPPLAENNPLDELQRAASWLGVRLDVPATTVEGFWRAAVPAWQRRLDSQKQSAAP